MKVIQINAVYQFSSTGRTTTEMHQSLRVRGIDSYVFCTNHHSPKEQVYMIGNKLDHKLHAIASRVLGRQGYFSYYATKRLILKMEEIKPDVVILGNLHGNYVNVPMLLRFLGRNDIATIVVLHDCWFFTGHCCHYTENKCYKWKDECHHCPILHTYNKSLFFDNSRSIFNMKKDLFGKIPRLAVVGVSDWITGEGVISPVFANAKSVSRIYNWIDLNNFYPRKADELRQLLGISTSDFVALGVSQSWDNRKGLDAILRVASMVPEVKFVLVGNRPNMKIPDNVICPGECTSIEKLATYDSMADVYLNFSIQETFGKAAAEALACGTPLIANNATANPELCGEGCGLVIDNNDEEEIVAAIRIIQSKGKSFYSERCRSFALENFDREKVIDKYVELFDKLDRYKKV